MTKPKPLGQIAYSAFHRGEYHTAWNSISAIYKRYWNGAAIAVAREVRRRGRKK